MSRFDFLCAMTRHSQMQALLPIVYHPYYPLADPAAEKEPGEAQSTTRPHANQEQGAVLSGHSDCPTGEASP